MRSIRSCRLNRVKLFINTTIIVVFLGIAWPALANPEVKTESVTESEAQIIQKFTSDQDVKSEIVTIDDKRKRQVMFAMGVPLLLFIIITVALGIAMGVFGKDVYIPHMIFAGLSLTIALAHAIVGLVWFWPF